MLTRIRKEAGSPPTRLTSHPRVDSPSLGKDRQTRKKVYPASWAGWWGFSETQRERITRSSCSLETGPQTTCVMGM